MSQLSQDQAALKASITKAALIWGVILGALAGGVIYMLNDELAQPMRSIIGAGVFAVIAALIFVWRSKANSKSAQCEKCGAAFSITRTDRAEEVKSSEPKETREAQPDYSTKVSTWVEDKVEVTDTYACAKCGDTTTKQHTKTVKRDEAETVEPAPEKEAVKTSAPAAGERTETSSKSAASGGSKKAVDDGQKPAPNDGVSTSSKSKNGAQKSSAGKK